MTTPGDPKPSSDAPASERAPRSFEQVAAPSTTAEVLRGPTSGSPTLKEALAQRVRFAGGELPLWSVLAPTFAASAVVIALGAAAATARDVVTQAPVPSAVPSALPPPVPEPTVDVKQVASAAPEPVAPKPLTLVERAAAGEVEALETLEQRPAASLSIEEAVALSQGRSARDREEAEKLRARLTRDPSSLKTPKLLGDLQRLIQNPESARVALAAIASVPDPLSADLLYEVWTGTPLKTDTTELARSLLMIKEVRSRATPQLALALDLRTTEDCQAIAKALPRIIELADKRSYNSLTKLQRKAGCGPQKREDCYPCLRKGEASNQLKEALKVVRSRPDPTPFKG